MPWMLLFIPYWLGIPEMKQVETIATFQTGELCEKAIEKLHELPTSGTPTHYLCVQTQDSH